MKLVNNLLAGINLAGAAEVLALAERAGLDPALALDVIERSSGQSWIASDRMRRAIAGDRDHWVLKNGADVIARHHTDELRFLVHWSAEVFTDMDELEKNMEGSDDLTIDKAIDMMLDDLAGRGIKLDVPSAPLHDPAFIGALNAAYDLGGPAVYPDEAPISAFQIA